MKKNTLITSKNILYKNILKRTLRESLKMTSAIEGLIVFGTNYTLKKHLPLKDWDRAAVFKVSGIGLFRFLSKIKIIMATIKGILPMLNYVNIKGKLVENQGIIPFLLNRRDDFYKKGITLLFVPELIKYIKGTHDEFAYIPVFTYDGFNITRLKENYKVNIKFTKVVQSKNFIALNIPHFGLLLLNNCNPTLFAQSNLNTLKNKFNKLISFINKASLAYYHQKGKYITETERLEDLLEKEEMLRNMGTMLRNKEEELSRHIQALDEVTKQKYELELQRDKLSEDVIKARQAVEEIEQETDANLATIAHTNKNLYMAQKSFINFVQEDVHSVAGDLAELKKYMAATTAKYPKLNNYQFWKIMGNTLQNIEMNQKSLLFNNKRSSDHMMQIMEYILAVLAYQRGREYISDGKYFSDLLKIIKYIKITHRERLLNLGISFQVTNKSGDNKILISNIYHFHLEKDIFINLLINSIQAFPDRPNKKIWIEIYSVQPEGPAPQYEIHYRDNGIGIPYDKKQAIFEGWTSKAQGSESELDHKTEHGVGGKTIYKRITQAGGTIKEIGIPGEGAHFVMTMAKFIEEKDEELNIGDEISIEPVESGISSIFETEPPDDPEDFSGKTILIIDDDSAIQNYIAGIFKDILVPTFATGQEDAWNSIYSSSPPDIITLDLDLLSTEKGENLLFDLNMRGIPLKIPIIVVSGADRAYETAKLSKLGAAAIFQKPVKEKELRQTVLKLLSQKMPANTF